MKSHPISPGRPIFIISPTKRAGTNYLKNLLCRHEDCFSPGPIWEDELLRKGHLLEDYIDFTFEKWNSNWQVEQELLSRQQAMGHLGSALIDILHSQFVNSEDKKGRFSRSLDQQQKHPYRYVTKTPKADNIGLFPSLFPNAYLLILVRNGRSVVKSAQSSFAKPFDLAVREWATAMEEIENFTKSPLFSPELHCVVRYEDIVSHPNEEMQKLMTFLGLDEARISLDEIDDMPVIGSSTQRTGKGDVHWEPETKEAGFDPIARGDELSPFKRSHFSYLAGMRGHCYGYKSEPPVLHYIPMHLVKSAVWWPLWKAWRASRFIKDDLRGALRRVFGHLAIGPKYGRRTGSGDLER